MCVYVVLQLLYQFTSSVLRRLIDEIADLRKYVRCAQETVEGSEHFIQEGNVRRLEALHSLESS